MLLDADIKKSYSKAVGAWHVRLDPGSWILAAQDFQRSSQGDEENSVDFICHLECIFNVVYGREDMSSETHAILLHGQLQDGLKQELMRAPPLSDARGYKEICLAAWNKEKCLAKLRKRQQYLKPSFTPPQLMKKPTENKRPRQSPTRPLYLLSPKLVAPNPNR